MTIDALRAHFKRLNKEIGFSDKKNLYYLNPAHSLMGLSGP